MKDDSELELWGRARRNDGAAFAKLFDLHRDRVYRRALGLMRDPHDAEDLTAAAFFELWRKRHSVQTVNETILPWLLVTTVNLSRNMRRSTARYQRLLDSIPRTAQADGRDAEPNDVRGRLAASLGGLSPVDGALLVLTALEGFPIAEAATAVGLKPATARVRLHRARSRLRDDLRDLDPSPLPAKGLFT